MTVALRQPKWTSARFLEWIDGQGKARFELEGGQVVAMAPEQAKHALVKYAVTKTLERAVRAAGLDCSVIPDGLMLTVDGETVRIPDASIQAGRVDLEATSLIDPIVLVEVVSPSSGMRDEAIKMVEYFSIASVMHYLVVYPDRRTAVHFARAQRPDKVDTRIVTEGPIQLSPPGISFPVESFFEGIAA